MLETVLGGLVCVLLAFALFFCFWISSKVEMEKEARKERKLYRFLEFVLEMKNDDVQYETADIVGEIYELVRNDKKQK